MCVEREQSLVLVLPELSRRRNENSISCMYVFGDDLNTNFVYPPSTLTISSNMFHDILLSKIRNRDKANPSQPDKLDTKIEQANHYESTYYDAQGERTGCTIAFFESNSRGFAPKLKITDRSLPILHGRALESRTERASG